MRYRNTAWIAAVVMALGAGVVLGQNTFNDVPDSDPRIEDIQYAAAQGWFQGYPDGSFRPGQEISEGQLAKVIRRARSGMTRGDAAVFLRGGIDRLQTVVPTTTTAATTTTVRTGEPGGDGPVEPGSGGPVDPNPPVVIEPTTTTTAPAATTTTTTTVQTGEPGGEGPAPAEPGSGGPVDPNPPVVIEPTTTTTAPAATTTTAPPTTTAPTTTTTAPTTTAPTTTTTTAPTTTYYYKNRPVPAGVVAGRVVMRYGYEHGWTDSDGRSGSLLWFESYIRDYDVDVLEDRELSLWAESAESNARLHTWGTGGRAIQPYGYWQYRPSYGPSRQAYLFSTVLLSAGKNGVHFIPHSSDSLPPGHPDMPTANTRMPRLHITFVPYEIQEAKVYMWPLWSVTSRGQPRPGRPGTTSIDSHAVEEVSATPERAKAGAESNGYSAPAAAG